MLVCGMKNTIPSLPRVSQDEYNVMTDSEKRQYIIQLQQEDTMKWQKIVAQFQSYMILISLVAACFLLALYVQRSVVEIMTETSQTETIGVDTTVLLDSISVEFSDQELKEALK